jgi:hypothetical protein
LKPLFLNGLKKALHFSDNVGAKTLESDRSEVNIEYLPSYAPELNPIEPCWSHTKYGEMANFISQDVTHLADEVAHSLMANHRRPALLHAFFQPARLAL